MTTKVRTAEEVAEEIVRQLQNMGVDFPSIAEHSDYYSLLDIRNSVAALIRADRAEIRRAFIVMCSNSR